MQQSYQTGCSAVTIDRERRSDHPSQIPEHVPSPCEIAQACAEIQAGWTPEQERCRRLQRPWESIPERQDLCGATLAACYEPRRFHAVDVAPTARALAVEQSVRAAIEAERPQQPAPEPCRGPRFLRTDSREVKLWLPKPLYERLEALRGPAPVAGLLSELIHDWIAEQAESEVCHG